jgi:hypothetical protein
VPRERFFDHPQAYSVISLFKDVLGALPHRCGNPGRGRTAPDYKVISLFLLESTRKHIVKMKS